jgi:hypothetical protein
MLVFHFRFAIFHCPLPEIVGRWMRREEVYNKHIV